MAVVNYLPVEGTLLSETRGGADFDYIPDPLGSVTAILDGSGIVDTYNYWPFGEVRSHAGSSTTPFTFVGSLGYYQDVLNERTYVRARSYQPQYGNWLTVDPMWPLELPYVYALDNPTTAVDPSGLGVSACEYDYCFYPALVKDPKPMSPFGACVRCSKLPSDRANKVCGKLSTTPLSQRSRNLLQSLVTWLYRPDVCNPCNPHTQIDDCCVGIATQLGGLLALANFATDIQAKAVNCACDCEKVITGLGPDGSPSLTEALAGFRACVEGTKNEPGTLDLIKLTLDVIHAIG